MTLDYHIYDFRTDVDKSIYDQTREEKKFFDKVLGLRCSVGDEVGLESMDQHSEQHSEDDQTVPSKLTDLPFSLMASSPGSAFLVECPDQILDLPRAPPPSYEEHKIISKFHHQEFSDEDQAARWEDIQDIIRRESPTLNSCLVSSCSSSIKSENSPSLDCQIQQAWSSAQSALAVQNSNPGPNFSIGQLPDWYSNSVHEPACYMPLDSFISTTARSTNSSPASTTGSFAPTYGNSYTPSMTSTPTIFDLTSPSRCTPSPSYDNSSGSNTNNHTNNNIISSNSNNNNYNQTNNTINKKQRPCKKIPDESCDIICGMTFDQLMSYIPESGHIQLWQFLIKLLCDKTNNNCIRWEGDEGHFTILNQEELAKRWGERKRRKQMTYEKLSRAIRYYYDKNYVNKIHGKKATYKFNFDELLKSSSRPNHQSKAKEVDESTNMVPSFDIPNFHATMSITPASSTSSPSSSMQSSSSGAVFNGKRPLNTSSPYGPELTEYSPPLQTNKKPKLPYIPNMSQPCYNLNQHTSYSDVSNLFNKDNTQTYY